MSRFCPNCGKPLHNDQDVCLSCGKSVAGARHNKIAAGILAIFLGGFGIHKFYLGQAGMGILYLLFCWSGITEVIGIIEGIIYLCMSDEDFAAKYH